MGAFLSGGNLVPLPPAGWSGSTSEWGNWNPSPFLWASYGAMYSQQLWVSVVVNKRASLIARLPLKVYRRSADNGREDVKDHPYARLLARPNIKHDPFTFWTWISSTRDIYGEAFLGKQRDAGGRPIQLLPLHPTAMQLEDDGTWTFDNGRLRVKGIVPEDLIHFSTYNPDTLDRGLSPLEPLRSTLENEAAARTATSSFWRRGARPGFALIHPGNITQPAQDRLKAQWTKIAAGADKTGETVLLEEGMKPEKLDLTAEEAQYIETRKLNREEVVAAYDVPPPAVHILDHATFSNITEQFRSVYRDTAASPLSYFEAVLEMQLRGSVRRGATEPDFGADVYAEFLLDDVLRGDFESRQTAYAQADYMTIAEKRARENLPFIPGTDRIVINAASIPLDMLDAVTSARAAKDGTIPQNTVRTLMGRLSWQQSLDDVDPTALVAGLNGETATVLAALEKSKAAGEDVPAFKQRLRGLEHA